MGAYYKYFAYGLGDEQNEDFVAWVAPYEFASGNGLGTTSSAPVYDRSQNPPILAGVVGLDFSFSAMERALGEEGEASKNAVIDRIVERSVAYCPSLNVTECQLESLRYFGQSDAVCSSCDTAPKSLESPLCTDINPSYQYPDEVIANKLNSNRPYEERACCTIGEEPREAGVLSIGEKMSLQCKEGPNIAMILGVVFGALVGVCAFGCLAAHCITRRKNSSYNTHPQLNGIPNQDPPVYVQEAPIFVPGNSIAVAVPVEPDIVVMPPPPAQQNAYTGW